MALAVSSTSSWAEKNAALIPARAALGASMVFHGVGKLKGDAPRQTGAFFEQIGLRPGKHLAVAAGLAEVFAGVGAILGIWTRPAALAVLATQAVALAKVHAPKGFDNTKGGFEFNVALMAMAAGLLLAGPGEFSLHEGLERLAEGRGARKWLRRAQPNPLLRLLKLIK